MWQITYEAPKGYRVNRYFWAVTVRGANNLWFEDDSKLWKVDAKGHHSTHDHKPKTKKAFERYLKKHPELKGYEVVLVNNYYVTEDEHISLNITAKWVD